ncbi:MAG: hypothetical protein ACD_19C00188G0001 [uncultured bacterium]|nr:MAG: hypothetical protein ACD_19C00188G0001 [uncultured bacterium]
MISYELLTKFNVFPREREREIKRLRRFVKLLFSFVFALTFFLTVHSSVYATALFQDSFTGVDGTRLNVHTPDLGTGWTEVAGTWTINSNKAKSDGTGGSYAIASATAADAVITAQVTMENTSGAGQGFIARYTDANNQYRVVWFGNLVQIIKKEGGVNSTLSSLSLDAVNGQTYTFALTLNGSSISLSIDGVERVSATSTFNQSATIHGIFAGASTAVRFDDFLIDNGNSITLSSPSAYQIFQRNGSNQSNIVIAGTYTGSPTAIEARFNGGAWTTVDSGPTGGTFSGTISNQSGQGTLEVRFNNDTSITDSASYVGVGDVFLVAFAQSNAVGNLDNPKNYTHPTLKAGMFREDHLWAELADQTDSDRVDDGSVWPLLATIIMADQNVPVAFITTADGNTSIVNPGEWKEGGSAYINAVDTYNTSGVNGMAAILGWLGEADAMNGNSQADYQTQLPLALSAMQTDLGTSAPLILAMTGYISPSLGATESELNAIRLAQMYLWTNNANIHAGAVGTDIDLGSGDGVHYNSDADGQTMTNRWWRTIAAAIYGGTQSARGPRFSSATYTSNTITTIFTGGQGNLVNQTDKTGWSVTDGNGARTVQSTTGTSNSVTLTLDQNLTGSVLISFASGNNAAGETLLDSGTYPLPPEPFIDSSVSIADQTAPNGGSVVYLDGSQTSTNVTLTVSDGTDSNSGINTSSRLVQRKIAPLSVDTCGSFGSFSAISTSGTYPNFLDSSVSAGNCYMYQYLVSDNTGNQQTYTSSNVVKVMYQQPDAITCSSQTPTGTAPWLNSAVSNNSNSVNLQFVNYQTPINHFVLEYGTKSGEYKYSVDNIDKNSKEFLVGGLAPNITYYFRIRTGNGCAVGAWSNEMSVKTKSNFLVNNLDIIDSEIKTTPLDPKPKTTKDTKSEEFKGYEVNIKVLDTNQQPVLGAKVTLHSDPKETTTDENGLAKFTGVEAGDHKILIAYNNFSGEQSINLSGDVKQFDINVTVDENKVLISPFAWWIIGGMGILIIYLVIRLRKNKNIKRII